MDTDESIFVGAEPYEKPVKLPNGRARQEKSSMNVPGATLAALQAIRVLTFVLSARAIFLISVLGAFILAVIALYDGRPGSLYVLIAYSILAVIPAAAIELARRRD
jgi:hypothetical protein